MLKDTLLCERMPAVSCLDLLLGLGLFQASSPLSLSAVFLEPLQRRFNSKRRKELGNKRTELCVMISGGSSTRQRPGVCLRDNADSTLSSRRLALHHGLGQMFVEIWLIEPLLGCKYEAKEVQVDKGINGEKRVT